ncbi:MAG: Hsp70 suppressor, GTPase facilitates ribosomal subunit dissociation [Cirrosporium novae-zelandiae]|nr:MAG: Hsp70 suppressor, GTPase facilitates ribosomal subunit dissociation [Cirrosporium novae-zelandiae]
MSRHRLIKNLDLDEELDDYDGGTYYDDEKKDGENDEMSPEDKEQMRVGTIQVREALGMDAPVTEEQIQEALWHYYYDVGKSVTYLNNKFVNPPPRKQKKTSTTAEKNSKATDTITIKDQAYPKPLSTLDFFKDTPFLNVPPERLSRITIEPLCPRGGLLGGNPASSGGKVSKLAALAAARKRENAKLSSQAPASEKSSSVALLDKLVPRTTSQMEPERKPTKGLTDLTNTPSQVHPSSRSYPIRQKRTPSPDKPPAKPEPVFARVQHEDIHDHREAFDYRASPSDFAKALLGSSRNTPNVLEGSDFVVCVQPIGEKPADLFDFADPSPDDIVLKAQNSKDSKKAPPKPKTKTKDLANDVSQLSIQETPKPKSKKIDVLSAYNSSKRKKSANFVVIGHVDHGKSTLMGRLLYDLKAVDQRTIDKYRREAEQIGKGSFALAWVLDQGTEERNRGVTIDIASNTFETEETKFTILDAPGHRDFVPNMIAGASQADFAVLVIDASTGSFESGLKGQTKEHAMLVRSMGVQRIIIAVNKMDTISWSQERFEEIQQQMSGFLASAGFQTKNVSFVPCSGLTGINIATRLDAKIAPWYSGSSLVEELEMSEPTARALTKPLRLTISDLFRGGILNPLSITGRIDSGTLQVGEEIIVQPSGEKAYINGVEVDHKPVDWAVAGQIVTLHLTDIDVMHLKTGDVICPPTNPIQPVTSFTIKVLAFDHLTPMFVDVHRGRLYTPGRITKLLAVLDKGTGAITKKKPKLVQPGAVARIVVELDAPVPLEAPGRVILRAGGETVAAGLLE